MADTDGLYIEGVRVASADGIACTYQGNDLTKPAYQQSSYSESFDLPDSRLVRKLTQNAEQLDSGSRFPYRPLSARVITKGETTFDGIAELSSFSGGWEVAMYEQKVGLFDRLDRSLKTIQLDSFNHPWTLEQINQRAQASEGVFYPLIDYGLLQKEVMPLDTIFPAVFIKTLIRQMLLEEGYTLIGDILDDELFKRLFIPFSESQPTSHDEQWQTDRYARITLDLPPDTIDRGTLGGGEFIDRIQPFNLDNSDIFYQGKLHNYNTTSYTYVCDSAMNLKVEYSQFFKALCVLGGVEVILSVLKNGNTVDSVRFEAGSGYNILFLRTDKLSLSQTIKCQANDRVQVRLEARRFTEFGAFRFEIFNDPDNAFVSFTPDLATSFGDQWLVSRNLPEITCTSLLVAIGYLCEGTWLVNARRRQVQFSFFSKNLANTDNHVDWSNRLDTGTEPRWVPRISPYAQKNYLTWKEIDETKAAGRLISKSKLLNYGDGVINVDAPVLESDVKLFEMPFAASTDSAQELAGYGNPVFIKLRTVSGTGTNLSISNQSTTARLLLASLGDTFPVQSSELQSDNVTVQPVTVNLRPCWFGQRPYPAITNETAFTLSFSPLGMARGEVCLINRYYPGLIRVLRRMRVLTVSMNLKPVDIAALDFRKLVRLQGVQVGALILSDGLYYLNKISNYQPGKSCQVTLIAF